MAHGYLVPQVTVSPLSVPRKHLYGSQIFRMDLWRFGVTVFWLASLAVQWFRLVQVGLSQDGYHNNRLSHFFWDFCLWSARVCKKERLKHYVSLQCRLDDVEEAHLPCSSLWPSALLYQIFGCFNICLYWFLLMTSLCLPSNNNSNNTSTSGCQSWDEKGGDISAWRVWTGRLVVISILTFSNLSLAAWRIKFKFKGYCLNVSTILNLRNENCKCCFVPSTVASVTLQKGLGQVFSSCCLYLYFQILHNPTCWTFNNDAVQPCWLKLHLSVHLLVLE